MPARLAPGRASGADGACSRLKGKGLDDVGLVLAGDAATRVSRAETSIALAIKCGVQSLLVQG